MYIKDGNNTNEYFIVDNEKIVLSYLKFEKDKDIYIGVGEISLSEEELFKIIEYLKENILEEGSYINVADDSLIAFLDNKYQAVEISLNKCLSKKISGTVLEEKNILIDNVIVKYYDTDFNAYCNFAKQNINSNKIIKKVDELFKNKNYIDVIILPENLEFVKTLGYDVWSKKYIVN